MISQGKGNLLPPELADDRDDAHFVPAPCQIACPVGTDAPSYIAHIWEGRFEEAFEAITATNPFSSICGRVCDAPCEPACRRAASDGPLQIRNLKRFIMDKLGRSRTPSPIPPIPSFPALTARPDNGERTRAASGTSSSPQPRQYRGSA